MPNWLAERERFQRRFEAMARPGATAAGGVHRLAASAADGAARDLLRRWFEELGMRTLVDPAGNMAGVLDLAGPGAPVVMVGSHLDSQPNGGRFDGALGVVAAVEAAAALRAAVASGRLAAVCNLAVANWTGEEGAWFQPSLLGSSAFVGAMPFEAALARRNGDGMTLEAALQAIGYAGQDTLPRPAAYLELHIECAGSLDAAGERIGVFERYWGAVKQRIAFLGEQAHTGPTPMAQRKDALLAAGYLLVGLRAMADGSGGALHTSAGRIEVRPNSPNVVPSEAVLFAELRSTDAEMLERSERDLRALAAECAERAGVRLDWRRTERRAAGRFDAGLTALCVEATAALGLQARALSTVPGHDAISLAAICPAAMLVVPCIGGVCHDAAEFTEAEDCLLGAEALTRALWRLCEQGAPR